MGAIHKSDNSVTFSAQRGDAQGCRFQRDENRDPLFGSINPKHIHERSAVTMKSTTPTRIRVRRFITDRYAYRARPNCLSELVLFGIIVLAASWLADIAMGT